MRSLTTLILITITYLTSYAQDAKQANFILENGKVYYQKVFEVPGENIDEITQDIESLFRSNANINFIENSFDFYVRNLSINYKDYGYSGVDVPAYIINSAFSSVGTIQVKEGRYRVTLYNITWTSDTEISYGAVTSKFNNETIEGTIVKNNKPEFRGSQETSINILSANFDELFNLKNISTVLTNDNW